MESYHTTNRLSSGGYPDIPVRNTSTARTDESAVAFFPFSVSVATQPEHVYHTLLVQEESYRQHIMSRMEFEALVTALCAFYDRFTDADIAAMRPEGGTTPAPTTSLSQRSHHVAGWIYIIHGATGHYKIGRSKHVLTRVSDILISLPFPAELTHTLPTNNMAWAEAFLHQRFGAQRANGEWFTLRDQDLAWLLSLDRLDLEDSDA